MNSQSEGFSTLSSRLRLRSSASR
jgi:hypothetical protein